MRHVAYSYLYEVVLTASGDNASRIAGHALLSGLGVSELVRQEKLLSDEELAALLSPDTMVNNV